MGGEGNAVRMVGKGGERCRRSGGEEKRGGRREERRSEERGWGGEGRGRPVEFCHPEGKRRESAEDTALDGRIGGEVDKWVG